MPLWRYVTLVSIAMVSLMAVTIWFFPTTIDFAPQNPFWNGLEKFRSRFDVVPVSSLSELPDVATETLLTLIPQEKLSEADLAHVRTYLRNKGTVLLADDWGTGNDILEYLGVQVRFSHKPLLDAVFNTRNRRLPLATQLEPSPLTAGLSALALNYATVLEGEHLAVVIVRSSPFSYLDEDGNGSLSENEPLGPFPIVEQLTVEAGKLVLLSDPSLLINSMLDKRDNAAFVDRLIKIPGPETTVLIDQSHIRTSRLVQIRTGLQDLRTIVSSPGPTLALIVIVVGILLTPIWRPKGGFV